MSFDTLSRHHGHALSSLEQLKDRLESLNGTFLPITCHEGLSLLDCHVLTMLMNWTRRCRSKCWFL